MPLPKSHRTLEPRNVCANCRHFSKTWQLCRAMKLTLVLDDDAYEIEDPHNETFDEHEARDA